MSMEQGWRCSRCGATNAGSQRFCGNCGAPQAAAPGETPPPAAPPPQGATPPGYGQPPYQPGGPRSGFPTWGWIAIGLGVAAIVAVALVLVLGGDDGQSDEPVTLPGVDTSPAAPADPEFEALLAQLPAEVTNCEPGTSSDPTAAFAALCVVTNRPDVLAHFTLYASVEEAHGAYAAHVGSEGEPVEGDCVNGVEGEEGWSGGGGSGRILCGTVEGASGVFWSSDGAAILGQLTATSPETPLADLYAVWQTIPDYPLG